MTTHPAVPHSVADILTQAIRRRICDWAEETDETTWRAQDHSDDCRPERWVIVATGQLAPRDAIGGRPGPLIVAAGEGIETRIQLPYVVGSDQISAVLETLVTLGAIPADDESA
jgi:hypothetical protein